VGDIVVIGAGLSGLRLARTLGRWRKRFEGRQVLFIDAKRTFDYLPILPDVAGGRLRESSARIGLAPFLERRGVNFTQGTVDRVDTQAREVVLAGDRVIGYETLVIACGSVTDFYGNADIEKQSRKLDSVCDAAAILNIVRSHPKKKFVVAGGGPTGIEIASNLALCLRRRGAGKDAVIVVERADDILGGLPEKIQDACRVNLSRLRVVVHTGCSIAEVGPERVSLTNGITFKDAVLIWAAGVRPSDFVKTLPYKKDGRGRLIVDAGMRCAEDCFAVGDAASFEHKGRPLRMAVQFAVAQADVAAVNVVRACLGRRRVKKFRPFDWGTLVPMANGQAYGVIVGLQVSGRPAWLLHYVMCMVWAVSGRMRLGILRGLITNNVLLRRLF